MGRIIVGVDGSENARRAARWALREARAHDATVVLVHGVPVREGYYPFSTIGAETSTGSGSDQVHEAARRLLEETRDALSGEAEGVPVELEVIDAPAAKALVDASENADLVVVGSRGLGGFRGLLIGSVSQQAVHHAACPVVVVPPR